jgi:hypothetical protein
MGFFTIYMGIEGGGESTAEVVPDVPGIEITAPGSRLDFTPDSKRLHFTGSTRPSFTAPKQ